MVSVGFCFDGKERLHFLPDKTKVNAKLYAETLLPELVKNADMFCHLASSFNVAKLAQDWIATNCSEFIGKDEWPPNLPDFVWGAMLERYKSFQPKPENIDELKKVLQLIWDQLPQDSIKKAMSFPKTSSLCESW